MRRVRVIPGPIRQVTCEATFAISVSKTHCAGKDWITDRTVFLTLVLRLLLQHLSSVTMATPQEPLLARSNTESSSLCSQTPMSDMDTPFLEKDIQELQQQQQPDPAVEAVRKF